MYPAVRFNKTVAHQGFRSTDAESEKEEAVELTTSVLVLPWLCAPALGQVA